MKSALRKVLIFGALVNVLIAALVGLAVIGLVTLGLPLIGLSHGWRPDWSSWLGLIGGALLWGGWHARTDLQQMAKDLLGAVPATISYTKISRKHDFGAITINWQRLDDYAAQLEAAGFTQLGEFSNWGRSTNMTGVTLVYANHASGVLVEVQAIQVSPMLEQITGKQINSIHFSIVSLLGGHIRVETTDHELRGKQLVLRSVSDVLACHPGEHLMGLLEWHRRLCLGVTERTGKPVTPGLNVERHVLLLRERFLRVRDRPDDAARWNLLCELDWLEANLSEQWIRPAAQLAALPDRSFDELAHNPALNQTPLIIDLSTAAATPA